MLKQLKLCFQGRALPAQERRKGHFAKVAGRLKRVSDGLRATRLRCANRTYGGLYLHSMHAVKRRNRTHEIHNLHKTHRPIFVSGRSPVSQLFEHFGESQHETTEAVLQAGLLPAQERRKGHFLQRSQAV